MDCELEDKKILQAWLKEQRQSVVSIKSAHTQLNKGLVQLAVTNALTGLKQHMTQRATQVQRVQALQEALALANPPNYMECFDISHTQGQMTIASCVVFNDGIPNTQAYRKFNIQGSQPGDDYAAMHQAMQRH